MKFTVNKAAFLRGYGIVSKFTGKENQATPAIEVNSDNITFKATNGEVYYTYRQALTELTEEGEKTLHTVEVPGNVLLPPKFEEVIKKFPKNDVKIELKEGQILLSQDKVNAKVAIIDAEFPAVPKGALGESLVLGKKVFDTLVKNTGFAAATSDSRPVLKGINMQVIDDGFRVVATDSHRLSKIHIPQKLNLPELNIPAKAIERVLETFDEDAKITLSPMNNYVQLKTDEDEAEVYILLLDGNYPDVNKLIDVKEGSTVIELAVKELKDAVDRALPFARDVKGKDSLFNLEIQDNSVRVFSNAEDGSMESEVPATITAGSYTGKITLNAKYVKDALSCFSDKVKINVAGAQLPVYLLGDNANVIQLILPVRTT